MADEPLTCTRPGCNNRRSRATVRRYASEGLCNQCFDPAVPDHAYSVRLAKYFEEETEFKKRYQEKEASKKRKAAAAPIPGAPVQPARRSFNFGPPAARRTFSFRNPPPVAAPPARPPALCAEEGCGNPCEAHFTWPGQSPTKWYTHCASCRDPDKLRAEIKRLRAKLEDAGVNPDTE